MDSASAKGQVMDIHSLIIIKSSARLIVQNLLFGQLSDWFVKN